MKKISLILLSLAMFNVAGSYSQVYKIVHLDTAGTLYSLLTAEERDSITDLTLTGFINYEDYLTMKDSMSVLKNLDLSSVTTDGDSIPGYAFKNDLRSLTLPGSITKIGINALRYCSSLTSIIVPSGVTIISPYAFASCSSLESAILPETLTNLGQFAFAGCTILASIDLPESLTYLGDHAFVSCDSLSYIAVPPGINKLNDRCFEGSFGLDSISIGNSVTCIGSYAFAGCAKLKSVVIPASVDSVGAFAFVGCPALTTVIISSSSETVIGDYAFAGNQNLSSVTVVPSEGTRIGKFAFVSCNKLNKLRMAEWSVTSIGEGCFIGSKIDTLIFPSSLKSIGKVAFLSNDSLKSVTFRTTSGTSLGEMAFSDCHHLISVTMNSPSVDTIGLNCFRQCTALTRLKLPSSIVDIGNYAFSESKIEGNLTFGSSLKHIGEYAFSHQMMDTLTFLPSQGTSFGPFCFSMCPRLTHITMQSPAADTLGYRCFTDCIALRSVVLPSELYDMQYGAFGWCNQLRWIKINNTVPPVITGTIFPYWSGGVVDLYVPAGSEEAYHSASFWPWFNIIGYNLNLSVDPDTIRIADTANTVIARISSSVDWNVIPEQEWLTCDPAMGMDTSKIKIAAASNPDTVSREASVTVTGVNVEPVTIRVIQGAKPFLSVSDTVLSINWQQGSEAQLRITCNQEWNVQSDQAWLQTGMLTGNKTQDLLLTAEANPDTISRKAIITIETGRLAPQYIEITQLPAKLLDLSVAEIQINNGEGSTAEFTITSNVDWTVQSDQSWLQPDAGNGKGTFKITLTASANPDPSTRQALVTVSASDVPAQTITVTQDGILIIDRLFIPEEDDILLYPNPVKGILHIRDAAGYKIEFFDTEGRSVLTKIISGDHETLDLSFLPPGQYLVKSGNHIRKLVKK